MDLQKAPQDMSKFEFLNFAKEVLKPKEPDAIGLVIDFPYDLRRSLEMKTFDASQKARWTAFVNNAGTLAHVVCPEADILVRVKYGYPIKHLSSWQMTKAIMARVEDYIKV
jgi:hypothetical protein